MSGDLTSETGTSPALHPDDEETPLVRPVAVAEDMAQASDRTTLFARTLQGDGATRVSTPMTPENGDGPPDDGGDESGGAGPALGPPAEPRRVGRGMLAVLAAAGLLLIAVPFMLVGMGMLGGGPADRPTQAANPLPAPRSDANEQMYKAPVSSTLSATPSASTPSPTDTPPVETPAPRTPAAQPPADPPHGKVDGNFDGPVFFAMAHFGLRLYDATVSTRGHFPVDTFHVEGPGVQDVPDVSGETGIHRFVLANHTAVPGTRVCGEAFLHGKSLGRACVQF